MKEQFKHLGSRFKLEDLPNSQERLFIDSTEKTTDVLQVELCMSFIEQTNMPNLLMCINQLYFQALSDEFFSLNDDEKASLEALSKFLIKLWMIEKDTFNQN